MSGGFFLEQLSHSIDDQQSEDLPEALRSVEVCLLIAAYALNRSAIVTAFRIIQGGLYEISVIERAVFSSHRSQFLN